MEFDTILLGDVREIIKDIPDKSVNTIVTSPPYYGLRDYGVDGQIGLEKSPEEFIEELVLVFRECKRILKDDGTLWMNLGDSYWSTKNRNGYEWDKNNGKSKNYQLRAGGDTDLNLKPKDLIGIPWRVALALQDDGWWLRSDIIWHKPNPMPEAVTDRPSRNHEYIFLLSKSKTYYYDVDSTRKPYADKTETTWGCEYKGHGDGTGLIAAENFGNSLEVHKPHPKGANKKTVWTVTRKPVHDAHFATFPPDLIEDCIKAGAPVGGVVFDPFMGAGTTALVAASLQRQYLGCELNPDYLQIAYKRINGTQIRLVV